MPDVMVVEEVEEDAVPVVLPRLGGGFLGRDRDSRLLSLPWHRSSLPDSPGSQPQEGGHLPSIVPLARGSHTHESACGRFLRSFTLTLPPLRFFCL